MKAGVKGNTEASYGRGWPARRHECSVSSMVERMSAQAATGENDLFRRLVAARWGKRGGMMVVGDGIRLRAIRAKRMAWFRTAVVCVEGLVSRQMPSKGRRRMVGLVALGCLTSVGEGESGV